MGTLPNSLADSTGFPVVYWGNGLGCDGLQVDCRFFGGVWIDCESICFRLRGRRLAIVANGNEFLTLRNIGDVLDHLGAEDDVVFLV